MFSGVPRECPCGPHDQDVLCPFGFWGYRYAIEQISSSDKPVTSIVPPPKCEIVVGETKFGVDLGRLNQHVARLKLLVEQAPFGAKLREGTNKASLETLLGADLPFVYFYCHGEKVNVADANVFLTVGDREPITAQDIVGWTMNWFRKLKRLIWNEVRPLIFINACSSAAIEPATLVGLVQAFIGRGRAAGVIGTEVRVNQELAMDVAEQFVAAWFSQRKSVEDALRGVRMDFLRQGNLLGLAYTPYCWSELSLGDGPANVALATATSESKNLTVSAS